MSICNGNHEMAGLMHARLDQGTATTRTCFGRDCERRQPCTDSIPRTGQPSGAYQLLLLCNQVLTNDLSECQSKYLLVPLYLAACATCTWSHDDMQMQAQHGFVSFFALPARMWQRRLLCSIVRDGSLFLLGTAVKSLQFWKRVTLSI